MQCDGQPHARRFYRYLVSELHKLAGRCERPPIFPEKSWHHALKIADERDRLKFASDLNSRDDSVYFQKQHICSFAASLFARDGFSSRSIHKTSSGAIRISPELNDEFQASTIHEERRGGWRERKAEPIDAAANGNGQHAS